jgi:hypothetical protein
MFWTEEQVGFVRDWTAALLAFGKAAFTRGTITDAVAWTDPRQFTHPTNGYMSINVALVGDAVKVASAFGYFSAHGGEDLDLGIPSPMLARAAREFLRADGLAQEFSSERGTKVSLADMLSRLGGQAPWEFCESRGVELPFTEASMRLIIEPGYPWPENDQPGIAYWSAKEKKIVHPERPAWLIKVEERDEGKEVLGVNPCRVFPPEPSSSEWPLWGVAGKQDIIVAHSMTLLPTPDAPAFPFLGKKAYKETGAAIENVRDCGGLLFPSLSIGSIPASNFGPISLIGHLGLVLDGLKPYKARGRDATSWVYAHDAWTVSIGDLMREVSVRLFDELHGHEDYTYGYEIWSLGPPAELVSGGPSGGSTPINTVSALITAAKRRGASFKRGMTLEQFNATNEAVAGTVDKYAYCEAKGRRVVSLDEFPFMIGPDTLKEPMQAFAKGTGYKGKLIFLRDTLDVGAGRADEGYDYRLFQWSWIVADAVKKLADPKQLR